MEDLNKVARFSSCRGVSFEVKLRNGSPFDIGLPSRNNRSEQRGWLPWTQLGSYRVFPVLSEFRRTGSLASSHFCDLDDDDVEEGDAFSSNEVLQVANDIEKQQVQEADQLIQATKRNPSVRKSKPSQSRLSIILLDQGLFTVYKRLFAVCFTLNMIGLVLAITGHFPYAKKRAAALSIYNILALTLCRSEAFLLVVFWLAVKVLGRPWVPLFIKTATTSFLQSVGGIHSSCGMSSVAWLIYALVLTLNHRDNTSGDIIAVASTILSLLCLSCMAAFPLVRHLHHNVFERTHRFAGWTALALLWVFVILTVGYDPATKSYDNLEGSRLAKQQELWLTVAITFFTILPWLTVRRVPVSVTAPSGHASIIKFAGGIKAGILGRISRSPLSEWHAFGIISDDNDGHMMLAGAVGDFTRGLVSDPPTHLWVRGVHFAGLPYLVNMYNRAVLVATGSGICVFLSFLLQPCAADVCVVWVTKGVEQNFGKEIKQMMSGHPKEKVMVHDTAVSGRPNIAQMTIDAARNWKAEVVVVTSNPQGSRDVVNACKAVGIPAFGPIWDS
ncbi:adenylate-forming reductase 03009 [Elaeis guineensis]|uniref:Adenylate-forming reductase 03009 n=1 Tax=Elaeis guineensis var. tenera TaxID=51953 RepID=A0A6I9QRT0_ELAGV|nr:adenylate-forming reductase 03009 [Elaeis guineensis]